MASRKLWVGLLVRGNWAEGGWWATVAGTVNQKITHWDAILLKMFTKDGGQGAVGWPASTNVTTTLRATLADQGWQSASLRQGTMNKMILVCREM